MYKRQVAGYGLTESTATVACENDNDHVVGSVGRIMPHVQVRIGAVSYTHLDVYKRQSFRNVWGY